MQILKISLILDHGGVARFDPRLVVVLIGNSCMGFVALPRPAAEAIHRTARC